ncbi:MAG TPA: zinc-binding dehydrogenase, partial [Bauldia sp.]|nr:zinc-binding dehydrogenase [Bauldia sp.]
DTFQASMFCLKRGGVLVTCGSTTGVESKINLYQLYQQQLRLIGSFGCTIRNLRDSLRKMAEGITRPVIDATIALGDIDAALARMESRNVFGKIIVTL